MVCEKIKLMRKSLRMTQNELAEKLNTRQTVIDVWETGIGIPTVSDLIKLAEIFNVSTDFILDRQSDKTISIDGLTDDETASLISIVNCYKNNKNT